MVLRLHHFYIIFTSFLHTIFTRELELQLGLILGHILGLSFRTYFGTYFPNEIWRCPALCYRAKYGAWHGCLHQADPLQRTLATHGDKRTSMATRNNGGYCSRQGNPVGWDSTVSTQGTRNKLGRVHGINSAGVHGINSRGYTQ